MTRFNDLKTLGNWYLILNFVCLSLNEKLKSTNNETMISTSWYDNKNPAKKLKQMWCKKPQKHFLDFLIFNFFFIKVLLLPFV